MATVTEVDSSTVETITMAEISAIGEMMEVAAVVVVAAEAVAVAAVVVAVAAEAAI